MARSKEFDEELVLDKAMDLFWFKGYNGISAQELVDGLSLSRSSLYDTYGDKRTLFIRALRRYRDKVTGHMISLLDNAEDVPSVIKAIFQATAVECLGDSSPKGCFMVNSRIELAPHDAEIAEIVTENRQAIEEGFYKAITRGQELGQISCDQPAKALAGFFVNNLWGLKAYSKSEPEREIIEGTVKIVLSVLEN
ncbi:TetR/AcrR family transcriptional regulator [Dyadobacter sp. CY356]|uniref:TetR/AcrR family transcriptional regulator n=1 Tax=Dyadobacter sp. CY356 TaxID=2906442 RepID=UPI001F433667|nr:TetR/AcrR family transcriptional regulator [Dyadobacter sp. CY356]MCF0055976.1 TetR/AcrR family transcriptional regulator [Dyadobacter sp. CY356]